MGETSIFDSETARNVYVSTDLSRCPRDGAAVAGRINGPFMAKVTDWQLFPNSALITIDATGQSPESGDVLDIYSGDATLDDLVDWWTVHIAARSLRPGVRIGAADAARVGELIPPQHCALWVVKMGGGPTFAGATVTETDQLATTGGALVTVGRILDPAWMPTTPADPEGRRAHAIEHAHMARLRTGLPLQTPRAIGGAGETKG